MIAIIAISTSWNVRLTASQDALQAEAEKTRRESEKNRQTAAILRAMIAQDLPSAVREGDKHVFRELLKKMAGRLNQLQGQPETQIDLRLTLADLHQRFGLFEEQQRLSAQAVRDARALRGDHHEQVAMGLNLNAYALFQLHRYDEALAAYSNVLAIRKAVEGPSHESVGRAYINLGNVGFFLGNRALAETHWREALALHEKLSTATSGLAESLRALGRLELERGEPDPAQEKFRRAVEVQKKVSGESHPLVADALFTFSTAFSARRDFARAEAVLRKGLEMRSKDPGRWRHQDAVFLNHIGHMQLEQGHFEAAEKSYREAIAIDEKEFGRQRQFVANFLVSLGSLHLRRNQLQIAEEILAESVATREKVLGSQHPDTVAIRAQLEGLRQRLKSP